MHLLQLLCLCTLNSLSTVTQHLPCFYLSNCIYCVLFVVKAQEQHLPCFCHSNIVLLRLVAVVKAHDEGVDERSILIAQGSYTFFISKFHTFPDSNFQTSR